MKFLRSQGVCKFVALQWGGCACLRLLNIIVRQASRLGFAALARRQGFLRYTSREQSEMGR